MKITQEGKMVDRKRTHRKEQKELEKNRPKKAIEQLHDKHKAQGEGGTTDLGSLSANDHADLIANTQTAQQQANLVIQLQRIYGNSYVQNLLNSHTLQAKLRVGSADDIYEKEADRVADTIQRQTEEEELQMKSAPQVQRQVEEEEEIQTKVTGTQSTGLGPLEESINEARSVGQPLEETTRAALEPHFGYDFNEVRVHTGTEADRLSRQLGAEAFTTGKDIFFREGAYQPDSDSGRQLISHELTHVVQQGKGSSALERESASSNRIIGEARVSVSAIQRQASVEAPPAGAGAEAGIEEARLSALKMMWDSLVVVRLQEAYDALSGEQPDVQLTIDKLKGAHEAAGPIREAYANVPLTRARVSGFRQTLVGLCAALGAHIGIKHPLSELGDVINPTSNPMKSWIDAIREAL
jgi:hypothetical protein